MTPIFVFSSLLADFRLKLALLKSGLDKLRDTKPRIDNGLFVRLMLGRVNMRLWKQADRINFKDEYNKFKSRTTLLYILWPVLQLVLLYFGDKWGISDATTDLVVKSYQLWLLYYYLTLSLRENILLANGSDILHWWIYHHYISMVTAACMLLWPNSYTVKHRMKEMLWFALAQGLVMLFQNNYQKKRLYVRKTLGKAKAIDVDTSETIVEKPSDLKILIPMLFLLYAVEAWFGTTFIYDYKYALEEKAVYPEGVLVMGFAFLVLAIGNAYTTGIVLLSKSRVRQLKAAIQDRVTGKKDGKKMS
jgi:hypothetical protein